MDEPVRVVWHVVRVLSDPRDDACLLDIPQPEQSKKPGKPKEQPCPGENIWRCYGVLFLFLAVVLCGAVILLVNLEGGKTYPGWTIYAAAGYSFTKIILAAVHVIRARKKKEQSWIMIRDIGLVDASVSILTLQTAMFAAFSADDRKLTVMMNGITGATVSLLILVFGIIYLLNRYI